MTTIGVLGRDWRARVSPAGDVVPGDGSPTLGWSVVAEDRWHVPGAGEAVRQRLVLGAPVVETAVRVPGGDAVERVYAVADHGGLTVVEVENRSSRSFAVVFSRNDLLTSRPPSAAALEGTDAAPGSLALPVGHGTTVRVALAHDGRVGGPLPHPVSSAEQVARGWRAQVDRGPRLVLPDDGLAERVVAARSAVLLDGPGDGGDDPVGFLLGAGAWVRLGQPAGALVDDVVVAAEAVARAHRRHAALPWDVDAALAATVDLLTLAGDDRAAEDAAAVRRRLPEPGPVPAADALGGLDGARLLGALSAGMARGREGIVDLVAGLARAWFGQGVEAYGVPVGPGTVSVAVRWHGARPALLWEAGGVRALSARRLDPSWSAGTASGEVLLGLPADAGA